MTKIYTKTGDKGETGLRGGRRVRKSHPRVRACGEVDELNSVLGLALAELAEDESLKGLRGPLARIQEELFALGAALATPPEEASRPSPRFDRGIEPQAPERLEGEIDRMTQELKPLRRFIIPGGARPAAFLHLARAVCRRAEREAVALRGTDGVPDGVIVYLNRLSDFLFTAARWANRRLKRRETQWRGPAQAARKHRCS